MGKITPEMVETAMDNEYDGIEDCVLVEEILQLKSQLAAAEETTNELIAGIDKVNNEGVRLRRLLEKAWNIVDDLDTQCASDVATGCWPAKLRYSEKDVRRINKEIEAFMENKP